MPGTISEPLDFAPTGAMLAAAIDELDELGAERRRRGRWRRARARAARVLARRANRIVPRAMAPRLRVARFRRARMVERPRARAGAAARDARRGAKTPATCRRSPSRMPAGSYTSAARISNRSQTTGDARVTLASLADARRTRRDGVDAVHLHIVAPETDRFTALATAFQNCGAYVDVPDGVVVEAPLQLVWMSRPGAPSAVFPHTVIRAGCGRARDDRRAPHRIDRNVRRRDR